MPTFPKLLQFVFLSTHGSVTRFFNITEEYEGDKTLPDLLHAENKHS